VFWINIPLIVLGLISCSFSLRGHSHEKHTVKVDWWGLFLLIFGLGSHMYGIIEGAQENWSSLVAWIFLGSGVAGLIVLIILDELRKNPLLDLHIFKENLIVMGALSCALAGVASTVFMFFDPLYLRILRGFSPFLIGILIAVIPAAQALISLIFERSVKWFGVKNLLFFSVLAGACAIALHRFIQESTPIFFLVLPFFLLGINWGLSNSAMITAVNQVIAPRKIGAALGTIATIWNIVGAILLAASTAVFNAVEIKSSFLPAFHSAINFNIAFAAIILAIGIWIRLKLKANPK
jgi:hypothetical protein